MLYISPSVAVKRGKIMKKNFIAFFMILMSVIFGLTCVSCADDDDDDDNVNFLIFSLSNIYGYTYSTNFTSSSGTSLSPQIIIYNSERLDWNMSTNGMGNNQFYYTSTQTSLNNWTLYWYTTKSLAEANDTSAASMQVRLGIDNFNQITVLVASSSVGAGNSMGKTPLTMTRTSAAKNTTPSKIETKSEVDEKKSSVDDVEIIAAGDSAEWPENSSSYTGTFKYLVGKDDNGNYGSTAKGEGSSGENIVPAVEIKKTENNTVSIKTPRMVYGTMTLEPFVIDGVAVTKSENIYYFSKGDFSSSDGNYEIKGFSVAGKLENEILTLRVEFKPGSMPFEMVQIFTSNGKN